MSLLSTPTGRPDRVFSLISLVRAMDGRLEQEAALRWLAPAIRATDESSFSEPQPDRVREVFRVARDLKLLDAEGQAWVAKGELPATRRELATRVHACLRELPAEDPDAVMLRAYAWFALFVERDGCSALLGRSAKEISNDIAEALGEGRASDEDKVFNPTKFSAWKDWMAFLGLGWNDLPGATGFQPEPSRRIIEELSLIAAGRTRIEGHEFVSALAGALPYLDGGPLFEKACATQRVRPPEGQLSRLTSAALRSLHDEEALKLVMEGDAKKGVALFPDRLHELQFFSHVDFARGA